MKTVSISFKTDTDQVLWQRAFDLAKEMHAGQTRKGSRGDPYLDHVFEVAELVYRANGNADVNLIVAAILHDVIEDSPTTREDLTRLFNTDVSDLVVELTDEEGISEADRWQAQIDHAPFISSRAKIIKTADKISNLRELFYDPPTNWPLEKQKAYVKWGVDVFKGLKGQNEKLDALFGESVSQLENKFEELSR